eukprot:s7434_g5.t1
MDQDIIEGFAKTHTKKKPGGAYRDPVNVKQAFREAKARGTPALWKEAWKLRKEARKKWELERLQKASQGDWGSFRALKRPRQAGWDISFAEAQSRDPHEAVREHLARVYQGTSLPVEPAWTGDVTAFTMDELKTGVAQMKSGKAVGVDGTSAELLEGIMAAPHGASHLLEYYNRVLATQVIPERWNEPLLILLPKIHAPQHVKEFRPIAMSSAVGKLFSRLLLNRALPLISPSSHAQCAGKHRQTSDYLYTAFRTFELAREWGHPLAILKLDLEKAFDKLDRHALIQQLEARLGRGAERQCWKGLLRTTCGVLQTPWGCSRLNMDRGIKQGSVESPCFFGHVAEVALALAADVPRWQAHPRVLEGMDAEEMLFVDDGLLWSRSCRAVQDRVEGLAVQLRRFGLTINPSKCQFYVSRKVEDGKAVTIEGVRVEASQCVEIMGIKMYVGISIYELVSPLAARARPKF